jgi:hypothetical protein
MSGARSMLVAMRRLALSLLLVVATLALSDAAVAESRDPTPYAALFRTPGNAAFCFLYPGGMEPMNRALGCWTPNDGFTVSVAYDEALPPLYRKQYVRSSRGRVPARGYPTLHFDQTFRVRCYPVGSSYRRCLHGGHVTFKCTSRRSGLTCTNRDGRGFWLGRYVGYRIF